MRPSTRAGLADAVTAWFNADERPWYAKLRAKRKVLPDTEVELVHGTVITVFLGELETTQLLRQRSDGTAIDATATVFIAVQRAVPAGGDSVGITDEMLAIVEWIHDTVTQGSRSFGDGWVLMELDQDSIPRPPFNEEFMRKHSQFLDVIPLRFLR